jgi:hypothetical protein
LFTTAGICLYFSDLGVMEHGTAAFYLVIQGLADCCVVLHTSDIVLIFKLILFIFDISVFSYWTDCEKF